MPRFKLYTDKKGNFWCGRMSQEDSFVLYKVRDASSKYCLPYCMLLEEDMDAEWKIVSYKELKQLSEIDTDLEGMFLYIDNKEIFVYLKPLMVKKFIESQIKDLKTLKDAYEFGNRYRDLLYSYIYKYGG